MLRPKLDIMVYIDAYFTNGFKYLAVHNFTSHSCLIGSSKLHLSRCFETCIETSGILGFVVFLSIAIKCTKSIQKEFMMLKSYRVLRGNYNRL